LDHLDDVVIKKDEDTEVQSEMSSIAVEKQMGGILGSASLGDQELDHSASPTAAGTQTEYVVDEKQSLL
jgi:hypothetical protein